jgi:predicted dehydrogenase
MAAQPGPRLRALGTEAAYVKWGVDVQEAALRDGASPLDEGFGEEPREAWGLLGTEDDARPVETEPGRYLAFYEGLEQAIRTGTEPPVPLEAGIATLRVIEAARESAGSGAAVRL